MPLPAAVQAASAQADAQWQDAYGGNSPDAPAVVPALDPLTGEPPPKVEAAGEDLIAKALEDGARGDNPAESTAGAQQPEAKASESATATESPPAGQTRDNPGTEPQAEGDADKWKHRYDVLQGKYNAEVPQLRSQLSDAVNGLDALKKEIADLKTVKQQEADAEAAKALEVTDEERRAFGPELLEVASKIAKAEIAKTTQALQAELEQTRTQLNTVQQSTGSVATNQFLDKVTDLVPDWESINAQSEWLIWLGQVDTLTGKQRQALLDEAQRSQDANRVAAFFNQFKASSGVVQTTQVPNNPDPAQAPNAANSDVLNTQVVPATQTATSSQATGEPPSYTEEEIRQLYAANRMKQFTPEQWAVVSASIDKAVAEGRVR